MAAARRPRPDALMLQRTVGNRGVTHLVRIQRDYDDEVAVTYDTTQKLSPVYVKFKNAQGGKGLPSWGTLTKDPSEILADLLGTTCTERAMAERLAHHREVRPLLVSPRARPLEPAAQEGMSLQEAIMTALEITAYHHATFEAAVPGILAAGLRASQGGQGAGISTHGRAQGAGGEAARQTYNKWSLGHVFITPERGEAVGYAKKMKARTGRDTTVIHVLALPDWVRSDAKVDVDSKAGLKVDGNLLMIGDGAMLNRRAVTMVQHIVARLGHPSVPDEQVQAGYVQFSTA